MKIKLKVKVTTALTKENEYDELLTLIEKWLLLLSDFQNCDVCNY